MMMKKSISDSKSLFLLTLVVMLGFSGFVLANQGDLSGDGYVNQIDLSLFAEQWLANNCTFNDWCEGADINHSGNVDFNDFASFAKNWLLMDETRVESLLSQMTLAEKLGQLSGNGGEYGFLTADLTRLGIPGFRMSDGPSGVRVDMTGCLPSTCFPSPLAVSATWDPELVLRVGKAMGRESRGKGRYVLLAPMVNIIRDPRGGRDSETLGEDPYLTTQIALSYIKGIQSQKVISVIKHFACNNQESGRMTNNVLVNERTLREIYLPPYEAAVKQGNVWGVMSAYNKVNNYWCAENTHLLTDILKNEWGFKGFVVSDWGGTHSAVGSANAGLDVEMPTTNYFGTDLTNAVPSQVSVATIDNKVKRILRAKIWSGVLDNPIVVGGVVTTNPSVINSSAHQALAREASKKSIVLLKNAIIDAAKILPLNKNTLTSIAVIGTNADVARTGNGGSSQLSPLYAISPLAGIETKLADTGVTVNFAHGDPSGSGYSAIPSSVLTTGAVHGLQGEYFNNKTLTAPSALTRVDSTVDFDWGTGSPATEINADNFSVRWTGTLTPTQTGDYQIGITTDDGGRLFLDSVKIVDMWHDQAATTSVVTKTLTAGVAYSITFEYYESGIDAVAQLIWAVPGGANWLTEAADAAAASDVAIVCVGTNASIESEGSDRSDIILPNSGDALIAAVVAANPKTIVVMVSGSAVRMSPWINNVPAVLQAWFGGQESGNAIADVLFGDENPSGKLPITLPKDVNQLPLFNNTYETAGNGPGYRYFDRIPKEPQFPFGHGLSYTDFEYSNLVVPAEVSSGDDSLNISVDVKNTGSRSGAEVPQLYIHAANSSVVRAVKELKGFKKITLEPLEKQTVVFTLPLKDLRYYNTTSSTFVLESGSFGNYDVMVGSSSRDIRLTGAFHVY
jgi:beta-glucosidase